MNQTKNLMKKLSISIFLIFMSLMVLAQPKPIYLWADIEGMHKEKTRLYVYPAPAEISTDVGVIICPGGSYHHLGMSHEGYDVAEWLNSQGITAFVLRYRVGIHGYRHPAMIQDIQCALQFVKQNMPGLTFLGVMGFSAGGHLATMAGAFHNDNYLKNFGLDNPISLRPDFVVPVYPVVSMQDSLAHLSSRKNLLGKNFTKEMIDRFSMEMQIPDDMPPVFLVTAKDDPVVNYKNSISLDKALTKENIKHSFILYDKGGHGYGISEKRGGEAANWKLLFKEWLIENEFIK